MEVSPEELKRRYSELSTEELLSIAMQGGLSDVAAPLLRAELEKRHQTLDEINWALAAKVEQEIDHASNRFATGGMIWTLVIGVILLAIGLVFGDWD